MNVNKRPTFRSIELNRLALPLVLILQLSLSGIVSLAQVDDHVSFERHGQSGCSIEHVYAEDAEDKSVDLSSESNTFFNTSAKRFISISSVPPEHYLHGSTHSRSPPAV